MRIRYMLALVVTRQSCCGGCLCFWWQVFVDGKSTNVPLAFGYDTPSWPTLVDKLLNYTFVMAYRCERCQKRFYALKSPVPGSPRGNL